MIVGLQYLLKVFFFFLDLRLGMGLPEEENGNSSVLAWRILGTEEPVGLPSMGSHRVGHDCSDLAAWDF